MPHSFSGRTITQVSIGQGAAGNTDLVAAPGAGLRVHVTAIVFTVDAAGTLKFTEGTGPTDLTGAIPVALQGGLVVIANMDTPVLSTVTANAKLSITTATGKAAGWIRYFIDA